MSEPKERLLGCFWEAGSKSGFVGRILPKETRQPHVEDEARAHRLATTWATWAKYFGKPKTGDKS